MHLLFDELPSSGCMEGIRGQYPGHVREEADHQVCGVHAIMVYRSAKPVTDVGAER